MAVQSNARVQIGIKRETTVGTAAGTSGGDVLRILDSPGFDPDRNAIESQENRADGTTAMGRLGGKTLTGTFNGEITIGGAVDVILEAMMRGTWRPNLQITNTAMTSITTTTNTIVAAGGSWITQGVRVGDIARLSNHASGANNGLNLRVLTVTATTLTVAGIGLGANNSAPLIANAVADTAFELTIQKKLVNPAAPVRYSHTVEQFGADMDLSSIFVGSRVTGFSISCRPNETAKFSVTFRGLNWSFLVTGTSPYFTAPGLTTGISLIADDSAIRFAGQDVGTFTGFDLDFTIGADTDSVIGSFVAPDVVDDKWKVTGTVTGLMQDYTYKTLWEAETEFEVSIALQEAPASATLGVLSIFLPRVKIAKTSNPAGGGTGSMIETHNLMIGPKTATTGYDGTSAVIHSSAP